VVILKMQE
jgi:hypothetical protein